MIEILHKALQSPPNQLEISNDDFHEWKHNKVTEALFADLTLSVLEQFEDSLPEEPERGMALSYKRDGGRELLDTLFEWKPQNVRAIEEGDNA